MTRNEYISPQASLITIDEETTVMVESKFVVYDDDGKPIDFGEIVEGDPEEGVHLSKWQYEPFYVGWDIDEE